MLAEETTQHIVAYNYFAQNVFKLSARESVEIKLLNFMSNPCTLIYTRNRDLET